MTSKTAFAMCDRQERTCTGATKDRKPARQLQRIYKAARLIKTHRSNSLYKLNINKLATTSSIGSIMHPTTQVTPSITATANVSC